ncbi:hypothetical protein RJ641_012968 [Dillenia turbinata]|uniref:Uncharacterized protein n=1 Tax=Dillenia turbinata TaxID=194707 RepID=A0AAN8V2J6_9MAGN
MHRLNLDAMQRDFETRAHKNTCHFYIVEYHPAPLIKGLKQEGEHFHAKMSGEEKQPGASSGPSDEES